MKADNRNIQGQTSEHKQQLGYAYFAHVIGSTILMIAAACSVFSAYLLIQREWHINGCCNSRAKDDDEGGGDEIGGDGGGAEVDAATNGGDGGANRGRTRSTITIGAVSKVDSSYRRFPSLTYYNLPPELSAGGRLIDTMPNVGVGALRMPIAPPSAPTPSLFATVPTRVEQRRPFGFESLERLAREEDV